MKKSVPAAIPAPPAPAQTGADALAWVVSSGVTREVITQLNVRRSSRQRRRLAAVAGAVGLLVLTFAPWRSTPVTRTALLDSPSNLTVSAPVRRELPDGSVVELKPGAEIAVEFSPVLRRVVLRAGEAHFAVAKNPARPFVVAVSGVEVRAIGTEFSVQARANAVDVLVTEGRVAVDHASEHAFVSAGELAVIALVAPTKTSAIQVAPVAASEQGQRLTWRVPKLDFSGTPLGDVIAQFNTHARLTGSATSRLELAPGLERLQVSGTLRADDVASLLLLLKNEFAIVAAPSANGTLALGRR
jgi:transmembrane sensor